MNTRAVQVRLSLEGGKQVETQLQVIGNRGQAALQQLDGGMRSVSTSSNATRAAIQNTAFQVGDFAVQVAAGTSATRALAMQLPQLLGGFGVMGAVMGAVVAVAAPMVMKLFEASDATSQLVDEMMAAGGTASSVEAALGSVRDVARDYAAAIRESGGASSGAAALVVANSAKEFAARKEVLAVEIELMRARGAQRRADIAALQSQVDASRTGMMTDIGDLAGMRGQSRQAQGMSADLPASLAAGFNSVGSAGIVDSVLRTQQANLLALRLARAEGTVDEMALQRAEEAIAKEFASIGVAAAASGTTGRGGGGGGGGGAGSPEDTVKRGLDAMMEQLTSYAEGAKDIGAEIGDAIAGGFSAAEDAVVNFVKTGKFEMRDLVTDMIAQFAKLATQRFVTGPLMGLLAGGLSSIGGGFAANMGAALTSFDGGGYTGRGSRSGGLDGRGGFLAMLHPQEQVIDHARGQSGAVVMHVHAQDAASFRRSRTQIAADMGRAFAAARRGM